MLVGLVLAALGMALRMLYSLSRPDLRPWTGRAAEFSALERLLRDLRCAWDPETEDPPFRYGADERGLPRLEFHTLRPQPGRAPEFARPVKVRLETIAREGGLMMLRQVDEDESANGSPGSGTRHVIPLATLTRWRAFMHDGQMWRTNWPSTSRDRIPRRVRLEWVDETGTAFTLDTWVARDTRISAPQRPRSSP